MSLPSYNRLSPRTRLCRHWVSIPCLFFVAIAPALADTNNWTKPTSGAWEEQAYWSLGVLPDATQSILFTNVGWKALAITPQTTQNFPQSMQVQSLRVGAPVDSFNTLLMNFSGLVQPLQTGNLNVDPNGAITMQSSAVEVLSTDFGALSIGGNFNQGDGSQVTVHGGLSLGGTYFLTNGTLTTLGFIMDDFGMFVQYGGTNKFQFMQVHRPGEYHLYSGQVVGSSFRVDDGGSFFQYGGTVTADVDIGSDFSTGHYILNGGNLTGNMSMPSARGGGDVEQNGGTNSATSLTIGNGSRFGGNGSYVLSNGVVAVSSSTTLRGFGSFDQRNGLHTITSNLVMHGSDLFQFGIANASYSLRGGTVSAMTLSMSVATFGQEGGSNLITGDIVIGPGGQSSLYTLTGGFLSTSNVILNGSLNSGFDQAGGTHIISSELQIAGQGTNFHGYTLNGGSLSVNNISISNGAAFHHNGGVINHSNVLTLAGGHWQARPGTQALGRMRLASGTPADSSIKFPGSASVLRLANSSGETWSSSANLYITNWNGSVSGGGATQLFFGSDANSLTSQQLARIKFSLSGLLYPAQILATGEVVPQSQSLTFSRSGNALTVTWGSGWTLQSSTNVGGPYQDVPGATSPYSAVMNKSREFFRLRQ
jgi:hypothetical protein